MNYANINSVAPFKAKGASQTKQVIKQTRAVTNSHSYYQLICCLNT